MVWLSEAWAKAPEDDAINPIATTQAAAARAASHRLLFLTGETVIREDSFDFFDRGRNIPGRQERRATGKTQDHQNKHESGYIFHTRLLRHFIQNGAVGALTTADGVYVKFRLWQYFGNPRSLSLSAWAPAFNGPAPLFQGCREIFFLSPQ